MKYLVKTKLDLPKVPYEPKISFVETIIINKESYDLIMSNKNVCFGWEEIDTIEDYINSSTFTPITEEQEKMLVEFGFGQFGMEMFDRLLEAINEYEEELIEGE